MSTEGICPKCESACSRDEVHNGVAILTGPWGCACGWSEDPRFDSSDGQPRDGQPKEFDGGLIDSMGGWTPTRKKNSDYED